MLLKKSFSTADQNLTGGFDNGLSAILIGEHSLASFLSKKSPEGISGLFNSIAE
jgi:hypothetical protein